VDPSHEHTFYQLEGMMIDREVSVAHLIYYMKTLLQGIFKREVTVRLRPGYFPFVEPGFELDIQLPRSAARQTAARIHASKRRWVEGNRVRLGATAKRAIAWAASIPSQWNGLTCLRSRPDAAGDECGYAIRRYSDTNEGGDVRFRCSKLCLNPS
jgi:hypothetical protein